MKRFSALLLLTILPVFGFAQEQQWSALYFNNGKLRMDTTLSISADQFLVWRWAESNMATHISRSLNVLTTTETYTTEGQSLIAFEYTSNGIKNIRALNTDKLKNTRENKFDEAGILAVQNASREIMKEFAHFQKGLKLKENCTFYIPFYFGTVALNKELQKRNAIPFMKVGSGGLDYFSEPLIIEKPKKLKPARN